MRVAEIMTDAAVTDSTTATLRSAAETMWRQQTGSLVIVAGSTIVGIVTERDILKAIARGAQPDAESITSVMSTELITVTSDTSVREAARLMAQNWIRHLPIMSEGKLVGVLSQRDVTGVFAALGHDVGVPEADVANLVRERRLARIEAGDLD